jgi:hypothetical protein
MRKGGRGRAAGRCTMTRDGRLSLGLMPRPWRHLLPIRHMNSQAIALSVKICRVRKVCSLKEVW